MNEKINADNWAIVVTPATKIVGMQTVKHPSIETYGVSVELECQGCKDHYTIIEYELREAKSKFDRITNGDCPKEYFCPKCTGIDAYKKSFSKSMEKSERLLILAQAKRDLPGDVYSEFETWVVSTKTSVSN